MKTMKKALQVLIFAGLVSSLVASVVAQNANTLSGAGATFPNLLYQEMFKKYRSISGTGGVDEITARAFAVLAV